MNQLKRGVVLFLVIAATVLPWTAAEALETFGVLKLVGFALWMLFHW